MLALERREWLYLVRSLGLAPEPSSHDWHVQPSCKRTDPLPPERAPSVQSRLACVAAGDSPAIFSANLPVLETCTNYASCAVTVNPLDIQDFHLFSTIGKLTGPCRDRSLTCPGRAKLDSFQISDRNCRTRDKTHLPPGRHYTALMPFRHKPRRKTLV